MLLNFILNVLAETQDKSSSTSGYFFGNFEMAVMNIATASVNAQAGIVEKSGIFKILNLEVLYLILMINASSALTFAGIIYERVGVIFFMTVFVYTFFSMMGSVFESIAGFLHLDAAMLESALAFLLCASFLVFYELVKPVFMGMVIFLVFNAIAGSVGAVPAIVHILIFVGIVIAVKLLFKVLSKAYKFIVIGMFALYGSLILLAFTFGLIYLPLNFGDYLQSFIDQGSVWGPLVQSWNSLIWLIVIIAGAGAQFKLLDKRHEKEDESEKAPAATEESK